MFDKKVPRIIIENIQPTIDCGKFPIKKEVGDSVRISADIFKDGHDILVAFIKYRKKGDQAWQKVSMKHVCNDQWCGEIILKENHRYEYTIEAYIEVFLSWKDELNKKYKVASNLISELLEGKELINKAIKIASDYDKDLLQEILEKMTRAIDINKQDEAVRYALSNDLEVIMLRNPDKTNLTTYYKNLEIIVDREKARYAAWYEMFPRSQGKIPGKSGTFKDCEERLDDIYKMGFDVVYFPPIHPIGKTKRKGPNNSLISSLDDPGCPYAIGNEHGGHKSIDPALGTFEDFESLRQKANKYGMEIALDFAVNCSPDHPYVKENPQWFYKRPDGTIKYAENPPKKYEDIYPLNFYCDDMEALWNEMLSILEFWIEKGVRIFRVDNPHTKPVAFWEWLINKVQEKHPDVIFLAEAFTKPKMMKVLAKSGFTQSYTYFTWRNFKQEIIDYFTELTSYPMSEYFRGCLFTNTPDILPVILQEAGKPAFKLRLVLAATLSSLYGIYSGYELCENAPIPGKEEYINSEKYEYKVRDWNCKDNIKDFISQINKIRKDNFALHHYNNLKFYPSDDNNILFYGKILPDLSNMIFVVVNLNPFQKHDSFVYVPIDEMGISEDETYQVHDILYNKRYLWKGSKNFVSLDPTVTPAHIFKIRHWSHRENNFDYYN